MKALIQAQLKKKAQKLIRDHKPIVIGVTGSVGKTSARNVIVDVLSQKYRVRTTIDNYNNELGLPLTILGEKSPGRSVFGWLKVLMKKIEDVPEVFVLEYGVDRPGDMSYLCDIAQPDIAVFTRISPVHAEYFRSVEALTEEKAVLLERTKEGGLVVLNADDPRVLGAGKHASTAQTTYGFAETADVRATDYKLVTREDFSFEPGETVSQVRFNAISEKENFPVELTNLLGKTAVHAVLPAIAIGLHLGLDPAMITKGLAQATLEPGRMNPLAGIKGSLIIDSSYNAAPASMEAGLNVLHEFKPAESAKRIAVLGVMGELGADSEQEHRMIGLKCAEVGVDLLITVGEMARDIRRGAIEAGIPEDKCEHFEHSTEAGRWMDSHIKKGDIVLVKGSQSSRMEKVVKDIMAEPLRAKELLVRQYGKWIEDEE